MYSWCSSLSPFPLLILLYLLWLTQDEFTLLLMAFLPWSHHAALTSPAWDLEDPSSRPGSTIIFSPATMVVFFGRHHMCVSSPSVQWGCQSACSILTQEPLRRNHSLQLWPELTWLSSEMVHAEHLSADSHLSVPLPWRLTLTQTTLAPSFMAYMG